MTPAAIGLSYTCLPLTFHMEGHNGDVHWWYCALAISLGLWSGLIIGYMTEYYTSHSYKPVREISETQKVSAATGIIYGLALGYLSVTIPILLLVLTVIVAHSCAGMYG